MTVEWVRQPQNIDNLVCNSIKDVFIAVDKYMDNYDYETATAILTREINNHPDVLEYRKKRIQVMIAQDRDYIHYADGGVLEYDYILYPVKDINYEYIWNDCSEILKAEKSEYFYSIRAEICKKCRYIEQAIRDLQECIKLNPVNLKYYMDLASAYERNENYQKAMEVYDYVANNFAIMQTEEYKDRWYIGSPLAGIYAHQYDLHKKIGNEQLAFNDLFAIVSLEVTSYSDYYPNLFIKSCYNLKKYDVALEYIENKNPSIRYFLVPFIYKKLGQYDKEKQYYIDSLKKSSLIGDKSSYLRNYRYLIRLEKNWFKRIKYRYRYNFDKKILYYMKKWICSMVEFVDYINDPDDGVIY